MGTESKDSILSMSRSIEKAKAGDPVLGPLKVLPGTWESQGVGWNMIALPYAGGSTPGSHTDYRLLLNRYKETLKFELVDKAVANRGINQEGSSTQSDQFVVALDYDQLITQIASEDSPKSGQADETVVKPIHREPGLWLHYIWPMRSRMVSTSLD